MQPPITLATNAMARGRKGAVAVDAIQSTKEGQCKSDGKHDPQTVAVRPDSADDEHQPPSGTTPSRTARSHQ